MVLNSIPSINRVVIILSFDCNIRCNYCFFHKRSEGVSKDNLSEFISWFLRQGDNQKKIGFLGGEPLLSFETIRMLPEIIESENLFNSKIQFVTSPTNGILMTEDKIEFLKKNRIPFAFSLDGYSFKSNADRFHKDQTSYDHVIRNLHYYRDHYENPSIWMTIRPNNAQHLYTNVTDLIKRGFFKINIYHASGFPWEKRDAQIFIDQFQKVVQLYIVARKSNYKLLLEPIETHIQNINNINFQMQSCGLGGPIFLSPNGEVYACAFSPYSGSKRLKEKYFLGHIKNGIDFKKYLSFKDAASNCECRLPKIDPSESKQFLSNRNTYKLTSEHVTNLEFIDKQTVKLTQEMYLKSLAK